MEKPSLSVLMAVRNVEQWLPATLDSLRAQTRTDFELIAVDDGSSDGTSQILKDATDLNVTIVRAEGVGLGAARNLALEAASAPLLAVLDGDDLWLPCYMELVAGRLETDPDIAIVSPELLLAVEHEITTDRYYADGYPLQWFDHDQLEHLAEMNYFVPLSTYRREVIDTIGNYTPVRGALEDWDLWSRALQAGFRAGHVSEPCGVYRLRTGSITSDRIKLTKGRIGILEDMSTIPGRVGEVARASLAEQRFQLDIAEGKAALTSGTMAEARKSFLAAARYSGGSLKQRAGALAVALVPWAGREVEKRRAQATNDDHSAQSVRRARE